MSTSTRYRYITVLVFFYLVSAADARNGPKFDRGICKKEITDLQQQPNFTKNTPQYFYQDKVSLLLNNGLENMTVTLEGCYEFCGTWSFYWDAVPRLITWIIPILLLLNNIELSPIDKKRFMTVFHALGDPIDTIWSLIHKVYIWNRLYAIGLEKSPGGPEDTIKRYKRARIIATVLAGFEEIAGAKIKSEDYYHMITQQLGDLGGPNEDPPTFEKWRQTARKLADARTNEFPRTSLAIFVYIFGLIAALLPPVGGGNTSPPSGRIGSAIFLSWLIPLALVSNTIGAFTSRRTCLTIMSDFVSTIKPLDEISTREAVSPLETRTSEESAVGSMDLGRSIENSEHEIEMRLLRRSSDIVDFINEPFEREPFTLENSDWPGESADDRTGLIRNKIEWNVYFESLQWLGSIYTYRPWKVAYLSIDSRTHAYRNSRVMALGGLFPIIVSTVGAFAIMWKALPEGFNCRHIWVMAIPPVWCGSAFWTSWSYVSNKDKDGHSLWKHVLFKDAIVGLACASMVLLSTGGLFNNCWCWSSPMISGKDAFVPLNTEAGYLDLGKHAYMIIVGTCIGVQIAYFVGLMFWWRDGVSLVRWSEAERRLEWEQEKSEIIEHIDSNYLLFWFKRSKLEEQESRTRAMNES